MRATQDDKQPGRGLGPHLAWVTKTTPPESPEYGPSDEMKKVGLTRTRTRTGAGDGEAENRHGGPCGRIKPDPCSDEIKSAMWLQSIFIVALDRELLRSFIHLRAERK